eukprot:6170847-Heterocapsa_arctica.AAC.1
MALTGPPEGGNTSRMQIRGPAVTYRHLSRPIRRTVSEDLCSKTVPEIRDKNSPTSESSLRLPSS